MSPHKRGPNLKKKIIILYKHVCQIKGYQYRPPDAHIKKDGWKLHYAQIAHTNGTNKPFANRSCYTTHTIQCHCKKTNDRFTSH